MKTRLKTPTTQILAIMRVLAWVVFFGLVIKSGAIAISYAVSCVNPQAAKTLYKGLDMYELQQFNFWHYTLAVAYVIAVPVLQAWMSFLVIKTLSKVNLTNPFKIQVAGLLEKISYTLALIWVVSVGSAVHAYALRKVSDVALRAEILGEFLFFAGLVFIISQVFKRGVEIQSENDLTV
ncbi:MAG TPA: DUF2975 domain-containing protein [Chryseosolibacter sp.]|nr:DUF2975 domain-containing protein [Chryseosolibacter sp.]